MSATPLLRGLSLLGICLACRVEYVRYGWGSRTAGRVTGTDRAH